jgi:23S rRNA pseudouridine1911/1915/1917 synthase
MAQSGIELDGEYNPQAEGDEVEDSDLVQIIIDSAMAGWRLDQALADALAEYSRSRLTSWIKSGRVTVDGEQRRPSDRVWGGEIVVVACEVLPDQRTPAAEAIPLEIIHEDAAILIINKPVGLVVHPGVGNWRGTLLNGLLHYDPALAAIPRGGIVHRLDKDTSGLLVVARSLTSHTDLVRQLQARSVVREYLALVNGVATGGGSVDAPIGRHGQDRLRMAVRDQGGGREAVTHYRLEERYRAHTLLRCRLETGRTHQIRVHLAHIGYPLVGDPLYGGRPRLPPGASSDLVERLRALGHQALHATHLALIHPQSGEMMAWQSPLPADLVALIDSLREDRRTTTD